MDINEARKKITEESQKIGSSLAVFVEEHLNSLCTTDGVAAQVTAKGKSVAGCIKEITDTARKKAANGEETEVENSVKNAVSNSKAEWEKASTKEKEETEQELARLRAEADKLRKDAKLANNSSMLEFKFQVNAFQTQFNEILKTIGEAELEASEKMATALKKLLQKLSATI